MRNESRFARLIALREANPDREARRQANFVRMSHRTELVPMYRDHHKSAEYLGHMRVPVQDAWRQVNQRSYARADHFE